MNGAVGVKTQFLSWLSKNNKDNKINSLRNDCPKSKCFIFDNDESGKKEYEFIVNNLQTKEIKNWFIKLEYKEIETEEIFNGYQVTRQLGEESLEEKAFILIYKNEIEKENKDGKKIKEFKLGN